MKSKRANYPKWVEEFRGEGREIKKVGSCYYLYTFKTVYDPMTKKPKKISTGYLGKITEDSGLIPAKHRQKATLMKPLELGRPLEAGAVEMLELLGSDILENLQLFYRDELAEAIFIIGKIRLIEPTALKRVDFLYSNSYDTVLHPRIRLGKNELTALLREIGRNRLAQVNFMKLYTVGSEFLLFDGTRIVSYSENLNLAQIGYNHCSIQDPQMNLLYCFSLCPTFGPAYFKVNAGDKPDVSVLKNALDEFGMINFIMIADKGFGSDENFRYLQDNGISYIVPLKRNDSMIDYQSLKKGISHMEGMFQYHNRTIYYCTMKKYKAVKQRGRVKAGAERKITVLQDLVITFTDLGLKNQEIKDYNERIERGCKGYTFVDFQEKEVRMGTLTLRTDMDLKAQKLYETYKERESIEDANKVYKDVLEDDKSYMQDSDAYNGWLFLNHISMMLYYRVFNCIKAAGLTSRYSVKDIMTYLKRFTYQKINGEEIREIPTKVSIDKLRNIFLEEMKRIVPEKSNKKN